jgi:hypothetical protein
MTAQIIPFPSRAVSMPLPDLDSWLDEVDAIGPFPNAVQAGHLLARCPDRAHAVAIWLAGFDRSPPAVAASRD